MCSVVHELCEHCIRLLAREALYMMSMGSNVEVHPTTWLVLLDETMVMHLVLCGISILEKFRSCNLPAVVE